MDDRGREKVKEDNISMQETEKITDTGKNRKTEKEIFLLPDCYSNR